MKTSNAFLIELDENHNRTKEISISINKALDIYGETSNRKILELAKIVSALPEGDIVEIEVRQWVDALLTPVSVDLPQRQQDDDEEHQHRGTENDNEPEEQRGAKASIHFHKEISIYLGSPTKV